MYIEKLNFRTLNKYSKSILQVEEMVWRESQSVYTKKPWILQNFSLKIPGKEQFSFLALSNDRKYVIGFLVAHNKYGSVHMSRIAITPKGRNKGALIGLYTALFKEMRESGINIVTAQTFVNNDRMVGIYEAFRFRRLCGSDLRNYLIMRGRKLEDILDDRFISSDGWIYFAYELKLE